MSRLPLTLLVCLSPRRELGAPHSAHAAVCFLEWDVHGAMSCKEVSLSSPLAKVCLVEQKLWNASFGASLSALALPACGVYGSVDHGGGCGREVDASSGEGGGGTGSWLEFGGLGFKVYGKRPIESI